MVNLMLMPSIHEGSIPRTQVDAKNCIKGYLFLKKQCPFAQLFKNILADFCNAGQKNQADILSPMLRKAAIQTETSLQMQRGLDNQFPFYHVLGGSGSLEAVLSHRRED